MIMKMNFAPLRQLAMAVAAVAVLSAPVLAAEGEESHHAERQTWSYGGIGGQYDRAQLRRGFQVYKEVCSACHSLKRLKFRNLVQPGGPEFDEAAVKALAAEWPNQITDGPNDDGEMFERPAKLSDPIRGPYKNDKEARAAQNGALPPDLSLIIRARGLHSEAPWYIHVPSMISDILTAYAEGGSDYVYSILTGYGEPPEGFKLSEGMNYNKNFAGNQIAMVQPIPEEGAVEYQEDAGAKASLHQNAADVTAFLAWASDPTMDQRKRLGWTAMIYLLITTLLLWLAKKRIWARVKH